MPPIGLYFSGRRLSDFSPPPAFGRRVRRAITMVELLVALTILILLAGLLLPAVQSAREKARETVCKNNLHQLNLALSHYGSVHKKIPEAVPAGVIGGWTIEILPFLEQQNLKDIVPVGVPTARAMQELYKPPLVFRCPRRTSLDPPDDLVFWSGHYVLAPAIGRKSFRLFDAPVELKIDWVSGPELTEDRIRSSKGPHSGGFFYSSSYQEGVNFIPPR